jgi:hypothetical protein
MGYGYAETFLILFLTHPGVILPSFLDEFPTLRAIWQVLWTWILGLPGTRTTGALAWTMYAIYLIFLFVYMYLFLRDRILSTGK